MASFRTSSAWRREMLDDSDEVQLAAKAVEHGLQTAPWSLSDSFVSAQREAKALMRLHGPGDPTGRGIGYSFIRDVRHKSTGGRPAAARHENQG